MAPAETALASQETRRTTGDEFILHGQLEELVGYEMVLIDCPPSLRLLTLNPLVTSRLVIVTEPTFVALQGIGELPQTRQLVRWHYNSGLELASVIVNRRSVSSSIARALVGLCGTSVTSWYGGRTYTSGRSFRTRPARGCRSIGWPVAPWPRYGTRSPRRQR